MEIIFSQKILDKAKVRITLIDQLKEYNEKIKKIVTEIYTSLEKLDNEISSAAFRNRIESIEARIKHNNSLIAKLEGEEELINILSNLNVVHAELVELNEEIKEHLQQAISFSEKLRTIFASSEGDLCGLHGASHIDLNYNDNCNYETISPKNRCT